MYTNNIIFMIVSSIESTNTIAYFVIISFIGIQLPHPFPCNVFVFLIRERIAYAYAYDIGVSYLLIYTINFKRNDVNVHCEHNAAHNVIISAHDNTFCLVGHIHSFTFMYK